MRKRKGAEQAQAGCDRRFKATFRKFDSQWNGRRTRYKISRTLAKLIWPAWKRYLKSLPEPLPRLRKILGHKTIIKDPGRTIIEVVQFARAICHLERIELPRSFEPTIGTLRFALERCDMAVKRKEPDHGERLAYIRGSESGTCTWREANTGRGCHEITEYIAYLRGADVGIGLEKESLILRLDEKRCVLHSGRTADPVKAATLAGMMKQRGSSTPVDYDCAPGRGLCRMCGRFTERNAVYDLRHSEVGVAFTATRSLSDQFCAEHVSTGRGYHAALVALETFDDTRARLQMQGYRRPDPKQLHSNPAVNWFESRLVRQLQIVSNQKSSPRTRGGTDAVWAINDLIPRSKPQFYSLIENALILLAVRLSEHRELFLATDRPVAVWAALKKLHSFDRPSFDHIAVLTLYSLGHGLAKIADMLRLDSGTVVTHIRRIPPAVVANSDEVNLGMAADYLVRRAKVSERQMEILYWKSRNESQSAIAIRLSVSRQAISKALRSIPKNLRFDEPLRNTRVI